MGKALFKKNPPNLYINALEFPRKEQSLQSLSSWGLDEGNETCAVPQKIYKTYTKREEESAFQNKGNCINTRNWNAHVHFQKQ